MRLITPAATIERSHWDDFSQIEAEARYRFAVEYLQENQNSILEIGCGEGIGFRILVKKAREVVGIDYSEEAIRRARENISDNKTAARALVMHACFLGFKPEVFDAVCTFEVLEHIQEPQDMLGEVRRVLKKEGRFIFSTPNKLYWEKLSYARSPYHFKEFAEEELRQMLKEYFVINNFLGVFLKFRRVEQYPFFETYARVKKKLRLDKWMLGGKLKAKLFGGLGDNDFYLSDKNLKDCSNFFVVCVKK